MRGRAEDIASTTRGVQLKLRCAERNVVGTSNKEKDCIRISHHSLNLYVSTGRKPISTTIGLSTAVMSATLPRCPHHITFILSSYYLRTIFIFSSYPSRYVLRRLAELARGP